MYDWHFETVGPAGLPGGTAYTDILSGTTPPADRLPREAIQNSCDARRPDTNQVIVNFKISNLFESEKVAFLQALRFSQDIAHPKIAEYYRSHCWGPDEMKRPLSLLYCEDFGTTGLVGRADSYDDSIPWRAYLHALGESAKDFGGGSFGFGKSVFPALSKIKTIVVYSISEVEGPRLTAVTFQDKFGDNPPSGPRGWLGTHDHWYVPIEGPDAVQIAQKLGFTRSPDQLGLSILIVDSNISAPDLIHGVETHWWPAIERKLVSVEVTDHEGIKFHPHYKKRRDLLPYLKAFRLAIGAVDCSKEFEFVAPDVLENDMGALGVVIEPDADVGTPQGNVVEMNRVALMRNTFMVVEYMSVLPHAHLPFFGVFCASKKASEFFRMSEPPAHDKWVDDPRLENTSQPDLAKTLVKNYKKRIAQRIGIWLSKFKPKETPTNERVKELDEVLGNLLAVKKHGIAPMPERPPSPLHYESSHFEKLVTEHSKVTTIEAKLFMNKDVTSEEFDVILRPGCRALLDNRLARDAEEIELINFECEPPEFLQPYSSDNKVYKLKIPSNQTVKLRASSAPFDSRLFVEISFDIESAT